MREKFVDSIGRAVNLVWMRRPVDTRIPSEVEGEVLAVYKEIHPDGDARFVPRAFQWVEDCFTGRYDGYQPIDARYHDFEHTLQGTLCMARLLRGRHRANAQPRIGERLFDLGLLAILFHDTGYLKQKGDEEGTGAKYTLTHVRRSADFAHEFLRDKGFSETELLAVQNMIRCTGVSGELPTIPFQSEEEKLMGFALATGDLLGQMAARDYIEKLPVLYQEFAEAVAYSKEPDCRLARFRCAEDLIRKTPSFFEDIVRSRLELEFGGQYKFLNDPYPNGPNPYLDRVVKNLDRIETGNKPGHAAS